MAVALFGVVLVITARRPRRRCSHGDGRAGDLLVLARLASFVAYTLGARRFADFSPLRYTALSATGGTLTIFAVTALRHADRHVPAAEQRRRGRRLVGRPPTSSSPAP